ncbi:MULTISPECIES: cytochrome c oxidase assembly protein [Chelativorans]|jgi:cytochrome c oxidase assembly protein subunit 11|uniref:Cytochrome c oxidase assembly protein CtaG n=1 Tax=Chelativorans sp. (strain BNC1) TaxID=266779 RepID=COXZ_CHESB|nr:MULTISPECIES: cytochrome c oxidase assembly protein [Chelativorans]Q11KD0.1 RecName: Full=Cytochrome c oxidase assembly protein CtaG [Chelativorans sp. BNC1]
MTSPANPSEVTRDRRNRGVAFVCAGVFVAMVGMSFAAVPLYRLFCQVTGYGGTTQRVEQYSDTILDRTINVRFDANTSGVPWEFKPKQREITLRIGETTEIAYVARNNAPTTTTGTATYNVAPALAGAYFNKIECFCFTKQSLEPGQTYEMPVQFFVDPEIVNVPELKNLKTITLSYTFYPNNQESAEGPAEGAAKTQKLGG